MDNIEQGLLKKLGIKIGHYTDLENLTGATVFIPDNGADIGLDIRGSDTGTFNTPAFDVKGADKLAQAVVLTGGSTFGLESVIGVMDYLKTPSVTGAVIYDRSFGNDVRPKLENGFEMAKNASYDNLQQGNVGVGTGATSGKWVRDNRIKGGFGIGVRKLGGDACVAAFVVVNAVGDVVNPVTHEFYADCGQYDSRNYYNPETFVYSDSAKMREYIQRGTNTTLAVIVTNVDLQKDDLMKVAEFAHDGMARSIYPIHTNWDGDVIFAIAPHSENRVKIDVPLLDLVNYVGISAADALSDAIKNALIHAETVGGCTAYQDL